MILRKIELRSFRQFVDTDIQFDKGITAIVGPNGAGKTTILEAVKFALYGVPCRGKKDDIPNMHHGGKVSVAVEFELAGDCYRCERTQSTAELCKMIDGAGERIAFAITGVTNYVVKLLRLTEEQFSNSYFTEQKQLEFLNFRAKDKQQQQVAQMLGIEVLADATKIAKEKSRASGIALDQMQSMLESKEVLLAGTKAKEEACTAAHQSLANAEKELASLLTRIADLEPKSKLADEWKSLAIRMRERVDLGRQLEHDLRVIDESLKGATDEVAERLSLEPVAAEYTEANRQHAEMSKLRGSLSEKEKCTHDRDSKLREVSEIEKKIDKTILGKIEGLQNAIASATKDRDNAAVSLSKLNDQWRARRSESSTTLNHRRQSLTDAESEMSFVRTAEEQGICPTCEQPLPDGHAPRSETLALLITNLKKQIADTENTIKSLEEEPAEIKKANTLLVDCEGNLTKLIAELQSAEKRAAVMREQEERVTCLKASIAALQQKIDAAPTSFDKAAFDQLVERLQSLEPKRNRFIELVGAPDRLKKLETQRAEKAKQFNEEKARQNCDKVRMNEIGLDADTAESIINDFRKEQASVPHKQRQVSDYRAAAAVAQSSLKEAQERVEKWQENADRIEIHRHDRDLYREVGDAMQELRTELNREIRPTLEAFAADSMAQITANRYTQIKIDDSFKATLIDGGHSKNVISGGEEDILALSLRIALSRYIHEKGGGSMTLLVLDEVFGSLDGERRANVLEMLNGLRAMFPQIILISHVEGLAEYADRVLRVEFDPSEKKSSVSEVAQDASALL